MNIYDCFQEALIEELPGYTVDAIQHHHTSPTNFFSSIALDLRFGLNGKVVALLAVTSEKSTKPNQITVWKAFGVDCVGGGRVLLETELCDPNSISAVVKTVTTLK